MKTEDLEVPCLEGVPCLVGSQGCRCFQPSAARFDSSSPRHLFGRAGVVARCPRPQAAQTCHANMT